MEIFNNREIATGIWLLIILILMLVKSNLRKSLISLTKSFFRLKIITLILIMITYTVGITMLLYVFNFWELSLLKDTIVWFCFTGFVMSVNYITSKDSSNLFNKIIIENIKLVIIIEFIMNIYSFPLVVEIFFLPLVIFIILLDVVSSVDKKNYFFSKILKILQFFIGICVLIFSIYNIVHDFKNFATFSTLKDFLLPPILTISFIPLIYFMVLYTNYEQIFMRLTLGYEKNKKLKNYTKKVIVKYCFLNLKKVKRILSKNTSNLMFIKNNKDVDDLIKSLS